jgi:hypothetical protein
MVERDAKSNIGEKLLQAVKDIKADRVGRVISSAVWTFGGKGDRFIFSLSTPKKPKE